jgi:tRNA dimethylallyltransferase
LAVVHDVVLILGPTAGGKSALAIALALRLPGGGEIVSADSMQVYRGMDIGTAKASAAERAAVPHHLIDLVEPSDDGFSVDAWLERAERAIEEVRSRGRWPIVVGGTNLYVQAFMEGLFEGPAPDPGLRARLAALDPAARRAWLERVDPEAARRIHANDAKRTIRAIEVHEQTGRRISDLQREWHAGRVRAGVRVVGLEWPVAAINRRINARVRQMFDAGLLDEVTRLVAAGPLGSQARAALGYAQAVEVLAGRMTTAEAIEEVKVATRRFAKHQRTWLRRFKLLPGAVFLAADELSTQELVNAALAAICTPDAAEVRVAAETIDGGTGHRLHP